MNGIRINEIHGNPTMNMKQYSERINETSKWILKKFPVIFKKIVIEWYN